MNNLIINGIDHSKFDIEWAKRGGVVMLKKHLSKVTYVCNISGTLHVAQTLGQKVFNGESFANVSPRLLRMAQAKFECVECGHSENADINAARNILAAGHAVLACGEMVQLDRSMKQKPTEGIALSQRDPVGIPVL